MFDVVRNHKRIIPFFLLLITALFSLWNGVVAAADAASELVPQCGGPFMLCGYVEKDSKEERIPRRFEVAKPFSEGLAAVRVDGRYGYIDTSGKAVIPPRFQDAGPFAGNYAEILMQDAVGIINRSGELVVAPGVFERIIPFHGDAFIAKPFPEGRRQKLRDARLEAIADPAALSSYNDSGIFHAQKGWLTERNLKFEFFDKPERGLIWAGTKNENYSDIYGLMRADGTWQVTPRYGSVQRLRGTLAIVESARDFSLPPEQRDDALRRGAVDRDGNLVIPLKFPFLSFGRGEYGFTMDAAPDDSSGARGGGGEAIVRPDGSLLANRYFDKVEFGEDGKLPRGRIGTTWYSIEPDGRMIPDRPDAEKLLLECPGGLRVVERGETVEFHRPGKYRSVGPFDKGYFTRSDCSDPFPVKRDGKWFMVSADGSVLGGRNGFENTYSFSGESHTAVKIDGKWGIIDRSGAFTVQPIFDMLRPAGKGSFTVNERTAPYWIDAYGKRVENPPKGSPLEERTLTCPGGLRFFEKAGLWGLQDIDGKTAIAPRFRALSCFGGGVAWVAAPDGKAWCPIGPDGQRRDATECQENYYPYRWTESSPESFSADPYESSVLWNRAWLDYQAGKRAEPPGWVGRFRR